MSDTGLARRLRVLLRDRRRGAGPLFREALALLAEVVVHEGRAAALAAAERLRRAHPAMAPFVHLERLVATGDPARWSALDRRLEAARAAARVRAPRLAGRSWATLSASSEVAALAARDAGTGGEVVVAVSLPGGEGRLQARRFAAQGWSVRLVDDAALGSALAGCGVLLLGADALTPRRWLHKVGTCPAVAAARAAGCAVWVAAGPEKWLPAVWEDEVRIPRRCRRDPASGVVRETRLYDETPTAWIDRILGPEGPFPPEELPARVAAWWGHGGA